MSNAPGPVFYGADAIRAAVSWEDLVDPFYAALVSDVRTAAAGALAARASAARTPPS